MPDPQVPHVSPKRVFGAVDEYGDERIATRFLRLWWLPLLPWQGLWIDAAGHKKRIKLHARSVLAGYVRTWVPIGWFFSFAVDTTLGYLIAGLAVVTYAWSWTWRYRHWRRDRLRADLDLVALGSGCPIDMLDRVHADAAVRRAQANFAHASEAAGGIATPEDIARYGSSDVELLVAAYGVLRAMGAANGLSAALGRSLASRILRGDHEAPTSDGAYREAGRQERVAHQQLVAEVTSRARKLRDHTRQRSGPLRGVRRALWGHWPSRIPGYAVLAVMFTIGVSASFAIRDPDRYKWISDRRLQDSIGFGETHYRVACDRLVPFEVRGLPRSILACHVSSKIIPVVASTPEAIDGSNVRGKLRPRSVNGRYAKDWELVLETSPQDLHTVSVYLETSVFSLFGQSLLAATFVVGSLILLWCWERVRRIHHPLRDA